MARSSFEDSAGNGSFVEFLDFTRQTQSDALNGLKRGDQSKCEKKNAINKNWKVEKNSIIICFHSFFLK